MENHPDRVPDHHGHRYRCIRIVAWGTISERFDPQSDRQLGGEHGKPTTIARWILCPIHTTEYRCDDPGSRAGTDCRRHAGYRFIGWSRTVAAFDLQIQSDHRHYHVGSTILLQYVWGSLQR